MKHLLGLCIIFSLFTYSKNVSSARMRNQRRNPFAESREVIAERDGFKREKRRKENALALKKHAQYCGFGETDDAIIVFVEWKDELYDLCLGDIFGKIWSIAMIDDDCMHVESTIDGDKQILRKI